MARSDAWRPPHQRKGHNHSQPGNPQGNKRHAGKGMQPATRSQHMAPPQPYIVLDANVLTDLFSAPPPHTKKVEQLLDNLSQPGKSTLIIPRSVINECLNWVKHDGDTRYNGYLDLFETSDGSLALNTDQDQLCFPDTKRLAAWLESHQQKGELRAYRSLNEMISHNKELDAPKGGIVIINTGLNSELDKHLSGDGVITTKRGRGSERRLQKLTEAKLNAQGQGDDDLTFLTRCMSAYFRNDREQHPRFMLVTSDQDCQKRVAKSGSSYHDTLATGPLILDTNQLLHGASLANLISRGDVGRLRQAIVADKNDVNDTFFAQDAQREAHAMRTWLRGATITKTHGIG